VLQHLLLITEKMTSAQRAEYVLTYWAAGCADSITSDSGHLIRGVLDPANSREMATAYTMLHRYRAGYAGILLGSQKHGLYFQSMDFSLTPQLLDKPQI